jgi:hypothetical protein
MRYAFTAITDVTWEGADPTPTVEAAARRTKG